jgi:hypothetical protein
MKTFAMSFSRKAELSVSTNAVRNNCMPSLIRCAVALSLSLGALALSSASKAESAVARIDTFDIGWDIKIEGLPGSPPGLDPGEEGGPPPSQVGGIGARDAVHYAYQASYTCDPGHEDNIGQVDWDITHYYPTTAPFYNYHTYFAGSAWSYAEQNWTDAPMTTGTVVVVLTPPGISPRAWRKYIFTLNVGYYVPGLFFMTWHSVNQATRIREKTY